MLQKFIDAANANTAIIGLILCGIMLVAVLILTLDRRHEKRMKARIRQLEGAVETKEMLLVHKDAEIQRLKVDLFRAREDGKREIHKRDVRIQQLELDKKQLTKWGSEK